MDDVMKLTKPEYRKEAVYCLNELLTDAILQIPKCMTYLSKLKMVGILRCTSLVTVSVCS